jgi:hypothetical protein
MTTSPPAPPPAPPAPLIFQKRPVRVEAMRLTADADAIQGVFAWIINAGGACSYTATLNGVSEFRIDTLEGNMLALPGDWIVKGTRGEFYPIKPGPFEDTFALVTRYPFSCCAHCGCLDPDTHQQNAPSLSEGHDDTCEYGCNDEEMTLDAQDD